MSQLADRGDECWYVSLLGSTISAADHESVSSKRYFLSVSPNFLTYDDRFQNAM